MKTVTYSLKKGWTGPHPERAEEYIAEYRDILREKGGVRVTARDVVERAREPLSVLHDVFEWDDSIAAKQWRLRQARQLLNHIVVIVEEDGARTETRAIFNVGTPEGKGYLPHEIVATTEEYRAQVLAAALGEIRAWQQRYSVYKELERIHQAIEEALAALAVQ